MADDEYDPATTVTADEEDETSSGASLEQAWMSPDVSPVAEAACSMTSSDHADAFRDGPCTASE